MPEIRGLRFFRVPRDSLAVFGVKLFLVSDLRHRGGDPPSAGQSESLEWAVFLRFFGNPAWCVQNERADERDNVL